MSNLSVKTASSIHEIDQTAWDKLSNGRPFQSHRWYAYGERVMSDCTPIYLLAYSGDRLAARASFWLLRNEPMPRILGLFRKPAMAMLQRWPLLICRSPLSYTSGLILADEAPQTEILPAIAAAGMDAARQHGASFLVFDYLIREHTTQWPAYFSTFSSPDPGTKMENRWASMDEYLAAIGKKNRQHYKRIMRKASELGIRIDRHSQAERIDQALPLIRNVEFSHGALPNPWAQRMLEHMETADGTFLTATINERLVGCGLLLEDNNSQMTSVLGLAEDVPYVYFVLVYESLQVALEHNVHLLRWGSGAYDVKRRLGFSVEDTDSLAFTAVNPAMRTILQWMSKQRV